MSYRILSRLSSWGINTWCDIQYWLDNPPQSQYKYQWYFVLVLKHSPRPNTSPSTNQVLTSLMLSYCDILSVMKCLSFTAQPCLTHLLLDNSSFIHNIVIAFKLQNKLSTGNPEVTPFFSLLPSLDVLPRKVSFPFTCCWFADWVVANFSALQYCLTSFFKKISCIHYMPEVFKRIYHGNFALSVYYF